MGSLININNDSPNHCENNCDKVHLDENIPAKEIWELKLALQLVPTEEKVRKETIRH